MLKNYVHICILSFVCFGIFGCSLEPRYSRPDTKIAERDAYINQPQEEGVLTMARWWERLGDPVIDEMVENLLSDSLTIKSAQERVIQMRERIKIAQGGYYPSISASSSVSRATFNNPAIPNTIYNTNYDLGIGTNWQIDLLGKNRLSVAVARKNLLVENALKEALEQSLIADLMRQRVSVATLERVIQLEKEIITSQEQTLNTIERRYRSGVAGTNILNLRLARENLAAAQTRLPDLQARLASSLYNIDVLLGRTPGMTQINHVNFAPMPMTEKISLQPPMALLDRRPDLRASELRLKIANDHIGLAVADLYPDVSFGGNIGFESDQLSNLLRGDQLAWSLIGTITNRLFEGGRLRANIRLKESQMRELSNDYAQDILEAVRDVENNLQREKQAVAQVQLFEINVEEAKKSEEAARQRYEKGLITLLDFLNIQRRHQTAQRNLIYAQELAWNTRIDLYLSLGGDWDIRNNNGETNE